MARKAVSERQVQMGVLLAARERLIQEAQRKEELERTAGLGGPEDGGGGGDPKSGQQLHGPGPDPGQERHRPLRRRDPGGGLRQVQPAQDR